MRKLLVGVAVLCLLLVPATAFATLWTTAIVVSVNVKAKTMVFKYLDHGKWAQDEERWNDKTEWADDTKSKDQRVPATEALAKTLKPGSKVYVEVEGDSVEGTRVFALIVAKPPSTEIR